MTEIQVKMTEKRRNFDLKFFIFFQFFSQTQNIQKKTQKFREIPQTSYGIIGAVDIVVDAASLSVLDDVVDIAGLR